jgi:hypothetical protein
MPERQSTPGGTTAEQDAEAPARGSAADAASSRPGNPDEPTRPVSRGDAATVGLPRGAVSTPAVDHPAARTPGGAAANGTSSRPPRLPRASGKRRV